MNNEYTRQQAAESIAILADTVAVMAKNNAEYELAHIAVQMAHDLACAQSKNEADIMLAILLMTTIGLAVK